MIYEQCSCGASIRIRSYARLLFWRETHRHEAAEPDPMVPPTGASSQVELSYADIGMSDQSRNVVGFQA